MCRESVMNEMVSSEFIGILETECRHGGRLPPTQTFLRVRHAIIPQVGTGDEPLRTFVWEARWASTSNLRSVGLVG